MGKKRKGENKRATAFLQAGLDKDNTLHMESACHSASSEKTMEALLKTAERWVSLTTSKASSVGHTLARPANVPRARSPRIPSTSAPAGAHRIFSFLDALPEENPDEDVMRTMTKEEKEYYVGLNGKARNELAALLRDARKTSCAVPLRFRVVQSRLPPEMKHRILLKLDKQNEAVSAGDAVKYTTWVEALLQLPLGEILVPQPNLPIKETLHQARDLLNEAVFGHSRAKAAILERFYQWLVTPGSAQRPLALVGVPGNGKTSLIRSGLARVMARPFAFITLGGSADSSWLLGHSYTYEGSTPGRIVEHLTTARCMNPIFYFDELDKCSGTAKGDEVINALIHFTDPAQSDKFRDRYIGGLDLDTSRALCIFSFNDASAVSPVLLDRLQIVETDAFDPVQQALIASDYLIPQILTERQLPKDRVTVLAVALQELVRTADAGGVRAIRMALEQAIAKVSLWLDTQDVEFLHPLREKDVARTESGASIQGGLVPLLAMAKGPNKTRPPAGMYA